MEARVNGITIHYRFDGPEGAPPVTLSHSLASNLSMWAPQMPALARRYRVLRFDTRGHGASEAPAGAYSLEHLVADTVALLQALGIERTHFVGLSMGGMIGQLLALEHPGLVASLVLCDTTSRMPPEGAAQWGERIRIAEAEGMAALVDSTIERWLTPGFRAARPGELAPVREAVLATPVAGYVGCGHALQTLDLTDRLGAIAVPTLVVVGADDASTPVAVAETIRDRIAGSSLVVLDDAAHLSNIEQPEAFTQALLAFLDDVSG